LGLKGLYLFPPKQAGKIFPPSPPPPPPPPKKIIDEHSSPEPDVFYFTLNSFKIGMILSSYEIANIIVTPVVSFLGGSRKKPVFCGWGLFITAAGFFIITLPHFISSPYQAGK